MEIAWIFLCICTPCSPILNVISWDICNMPRCSHMASPSSLTLFLWIGFFLWIPHDCHLWMSITQDSSCLHDHNLDSPWHALTLFLSCSGFTLYGIAWFVHIHSPLVDERYMLLLHFILLSWLFIHDYVGCPTFDYLLGYDLITYMSICIAAQ